MVGRWLRQVAAVVVVVITADAVCSAQTVPGWMMHIQPGSAVRVTMKTGEAFDAIWMGPDGDRAVFERVDPHETISVSTDSVRKVRTRRRASSPSSNNTYMAQLGVAAGVFGALAILTLIVTGYR